MKHRCDNCDRAKRVTFPVTVKGVRAWWCAACVVRSHR